MSDRDACVARFRCSLRNGAALIGEFSHPHKGAAGLSLGEACAPMNRRALAVARVTTAVAVRSRVNARAYLRAATTAAAAGLDGADLTAHCGLRAHGSVWPLPWLRQSKRCGAGCGEVEGTVRSHALIGLFVTPKSAAPRSTAAAGCTVTLVSTRVRPYPKAVAQ